MGNGMSPSPPRRNVTDAPIGAVGILGENSVELSHALGEIRPRRLNQEVLDRIRLIDP